MAARKAEVHRKTNETDIQLEVFRGNGIRQLATLTRHDIAAASLRRFGAVIVARSRSEVVELASCSVSADQKGASDSSPTYSTFSPQATPVLLDVSR